MAFFIYNDTEKVNCLEMLLIYQEVIWQTFLNYTKSHTEHNCKNICFCSISWMYTAMLLWHVTNSKVLEGNGRDLIKVLFWFFLALLRKITKNFSEGSEFSVRKFNQRHNKCVCVCVCVCV